VLGITHFAVGATGGVLLNQKLNRDRLLVPVVSGIFAMAADIPKLVNTRATRLVHDTLVSNVFWLHGVLDSLETSAPALEGAVALIALLGTAVFTTYSTSRHTS